MEKSYKMQQKHYHSLGICKIYYSHFIFEVMYQYPLIDYLAWVGVVKGPSFSSSSGDVEWVFFLHPERSEADLDSLFMKFFRNMIRIKAVTAKEIGQSDNQNWG